MHQTTAAMHGLHCGPSCEGLAKAPARCSPRAACGNCAVQARSVWDPFKPDLLPLLAVLVKAGGDQADVTPATAHSTCEGLARGSDIIGGIDSTGSIGAESEAPIALFDVVDLIFMLELFEPVAPFGPDLPLYIDTLTPKVRGT